MKTLFFSLLISLCATNLFAQMIKPADPFAHTYSIVARDSATGEMAVGVQSHWFSVGTVVSWAEAGVGAIATQSFANVSFGPRGLALLREGKSPQQVLDELLRDDEAREYRQVAIIDPQGRVAVHTGNKCVDYAGHTSGTNFSVQANMMLNDKVWPAMAKSFEKNKNLPLAERVLAAMQAGQAAGGDIRGQQSAAILVVKGQSSNKPWEDKLIDLRVDDNPQPLQELERLLRVFRAYEHMNRGDLAIEKGNMQEAMQEYTAAEKMFPNNIEMQYWHAITLANGGKTAEAAAMLKKIFKKDKNWQEMTRRLPKAGLLQVSEKELKQLLGE
ncbi:DUF1028 domain-containing protein [Cesiribacter andamanensis]|uniref:Putative Zn-dependent protease n=1 Tax=Cesiribacter andamanensis AMV16 TaxID=1279009 RepID=M7NS55_9BACT|nr:DUF1028 domain-containing protein [Cesiribacter andamanensis]EMR01284.1 Putative Zn-dependent protease [Cesiribacter andamanensis AMV16]